MNSKPNGYRVEVLSRGHGVKNYRTVGLCGLTRAEAEKYVDFLKLAEYDSYGNMYVPCEDEISEFEVACIPLYEKHKLTFDETRPTYPAIEIIEELTGLNEYSEYYVLRLVEKIRVQYLPDGNAIEDISHEFGCYYKE